MGFFDEGRSAQPVDVVAFFDSKVPEWVARCVGAGALVSIGTTSDGGALGVTVTLDGRWVREYFRESDPACEWLEIAFEAIKAEGGRPSASSGRRQRSRSTRGA